MSAGPTTLHCFFMMMMPTPCDEGLPWYSGQPLTALTELGGMGQGVVVLHHAILALSGVAGVGRDCGVKDRKFGYYVGETGSH